MSPEEPNPLVTRLVRELCGNTVGEDHDVGLSIGGIRAADIAARHGTPCYVYDAETLKRRFSAVESTLGVQTLYAIKANPSLAIANVLAEAGAGADVASAGELHVALRAGIPAEKVQFAGPGKGADDLALAVRSRIGAINVESAEEYDVLREIGEQQGIRPRVALRINPALALAAARLRMGGGSSKFGIDSESILDLARRVKRDDAMDLRGLHCYVGSQVFDVDAWIESVRGIVSCAEELERDLGIELPSLNIGGGFGVPTFEGDADFDLPAAGSALREVLDAPRREVCVELGRYLVGPAGVYLTRVVSTKRSRGRQFVVLDGGLHHFGAAAGLGSVLRRPFPIVAAHDPESTGGEPQTICGPLCTPADEFTSAAELPPLRPGDLVAVLSAGAYGLTFSPVMFLSHPTPAEVLVTDGQAHLVRQPGRPEDALRGQFLPGEA